MTLSDVINVVPPNETVTVYDYTTGEILIDRNSILYEFSKIEHLKVCCIEVGKCYGDLIIGVRENK